MTINFSTEDFKNGQEKKMTNKHLKQSSTFHSSWEVEINPQ
jgi:hypothetical protein